MDFLHNDREIFTQAVNLVTAKKGIRSEIVEKDYYVSMLLKYLSERLPFIVFKGGTSLSKCHGAIKRFSEDIDITIDMNLSQGQKKRVKEAVVEVCNLLNLEILNLADTRSRRDYNRYEIAYNPLYRIEASVVLPNVILETSYTTVSFPTVILPVRNYIGDMMESEAPDYIEKYGLMPFEMKVNGHSRHLYDIYKLLPLVPQNEDFIKLVRKVRAVRSESDVCPSAKEDVNLPELLKMIITENTYRADYMTVTEKLLEENLKYDEVIVALKTISENGMFE